MPDKRVLVPAAAAAVVAVLAAGVAIARSDAGRGSPRPAAHSPHSAPTRSVPDLPFPATTAREPRRCTVAGISARLVSATWRRAGTVIIMRIGAAHPCVIASGGWPVVRLRLADGSTPVAKAAGGYARFAVMAKPSPFVIYLRSKGHPSVLVLGPGRRALIVLLSAGVPGNACTTSDRAMIFPAPSALGASNAVSIRPPVKLCGGLWTLVYMSARVRDAPGLALKALRQLDKGCRRSPGGLCTHFA